MASDCPPDEDGNRMAERAAHLSLTVHRFVEEIESVLTSVKEGAFSELKALPALRRDLLSASKQLRDTEIQLYEQERKTRGGGAAGVIDLDASRDSIGRKLDRLRAARDPDRVS